MSARETTVTGRQGSLRGPAAGVVRRRGNIGGRGEHWHLTRDSRGHFRTTSQENPIDFVKHRAAWLGGLALASAAIVGGIAYVAARSAGTTSPNATTPAASGSSSTTAPASTSGSQMHTVPVTNGTNTSVTVNQGDVLNVTTPSGSTAPGWSQTGGAGTGGSILINGQLMGSYAATGAAIQINVNWTMGGISQTATLNLTVNPTA
jgi:hypothetical protein